MSKKEIFILMAEDDDGDFELTKQSLAKSKLDADIFRVEDGFEALEYLRRTGKYEDAKKPDLVLLDLNMPRMDGRQTLKEIKTDQFLRKIPVVILTTSDADLDVNATYDLGANCYVKKPVDLSDFQRVVHDVSNFWFTVVKLPTS